VTARQASFGLLEGADILLFFLAVGPTKFLNQWKPKNLFFGKKTKELSRTEVEKMQKITSILHFMVQGIICHEN
jgi:hypothetical protein